LDTKILIDHLTRAIKFQSYKDLEVYVKVFNPCTVGGTPCVKVADINVGFDWDNGKILLTTESPLTELTKEDVLAIHKSAKEGQSWHSFNMYKKQAERIEELETIIKNFNNYP